MLNNKKGFYTIEALIAIVVFLIGILGVAKIQTNSIQATSDAQYRVNATYLSDSIVGQMWVNKPNIDSYAIGTGDGYNTWITEVNSSLPGSATNPPTIVITKLTNSAYSVVITMNWKAPGSNIMSSQTIESTIY